ncbi:uncharacterized protein ColSpa_00640 [Colletotrichum spaethianum]|uniref:Ankyrin repeat protein n=1 Tax=Colletotrichum spaethianum TaxID=700344 RepID=A0AA37P6T5_9PEZI|nr:uncharacterized protein ColSpa_00640 [Colletotrichum spaethianum]GKT40459.1 hypothetical protein ColSpa_00640 [Colletotrichum spaethianum]
MFNLGGFDPEASRKLLDLFRTEDENSIDLATYYSGLPRNIKFYDLIRWVTDPVTGDTGVHIAAAAGNVKVLDAITKSFGRDWLPNV